MGKYGLSVFEKERISVYIIYRRKNKPGCSRQETTFAFREFGKHFGNSEKRKEGRS